MNAIIRNLEDWRTLAKKILPHLKPGTIVALSGPLGAGKTTLVQALAKALGATAVPRSPTFSLLRTYKLRHPILNRLVHIDAYRLEHAKDLLVLDMDEELLKPGTLMIIEWAEKVSAWIQTKRNIQIEIRPMARHETRKITISLQ